MTDKAPVAVYDFDHTSIDVSSPLQLVTRLLRERESEFRLSVLTSLKIGFWGLGYKMRLPVSESWVRGQIFKAFTGRPKEDADLYMQQFYDEVIEPEFRPDAHESMRKNAEAGRTVLVVSASFEPIVLRAMEKHPFEAQISTRMKADANGMYTREVDGLPMEGDEKARAIVQWCNERFGEGGWTIVEAYGDHHSDAPMLELAEHAFAVTPNSGLENIAKAKGWPILDWSIK